MESSLKHTSGAHPLLAVCVHGLGLQFVQLTISFGAEVSRLFLSPCTQINASIQLEAHLDA